MSVIDDPLTLARQLGTALGLGLLVGLQRERAASSVAGIRTFSMVTVFGFLCALMSGGAAWMPAAGLLALSGLLIVGHQARLHTDEAFPGLTTEVAALTMYAAGAFLAFGHTWISLCVGGGVAVMLHLKPQMHSLARRIGDEDFRAIMQFALISLVILPVLPNQGFGPYEVLNPFKIWLLVVLIVGISLAGYVAYQLLGQTAGSFLAGILGGMISSTASTVSFARRARAEPALAGISSLVIAIASTVVFGRVLLIMGAISPGLLADGWLPLTTLGVVLAFYCLVHYWATRDRTTELPRHTNPSELKSALFFAAAFAVILLAVAAAKDYLGKEGLYVVAVLSGLTDMDAITLSLSEMTRAGNLEHGLGWRLIMVAILSNMVFKAAAVRAIGGFAMLRRTALYFGTALLGGGAILLFWP